MNEILDPLLLARWQFGLTTVYHFLFVPITLGLVVVVAIYQTAWYKTGKAHYLQLTHFFGKLFLINFAMGVVTGIVQEFQFGMNWSSYSRFVGDVFGAPLALEGLLAFFLEATFIGLWIFGWTRLSKKLHLATIWLTAIGTSLSAYFIIAANSFMQNPVGYEINPDRGRAELISLWEVVTNKVALASFPHTMLASFMVAAGVMISVAAWHLSRGQHLETMRPALKFGMWLMVFAGVGILISGDALGRVMVEVQPMKMAAAEALYQTAQGADASFSIFTLGTPDGVTELFSIRIPYLLAFLSTGSFQGTVEGINDLNAYYQEVFGPGDYMPIIWVAYWSFRWMIGLGMAHVAIAAVGLFLTRKGRMPQNTLVWKVAIWGAPLALGASIFGWVFTEMARQPWIVFGLMRTEDGVSPGTSSLEVLISLVAFTLVYGALAAVNFSLIKRAAQKGPLPAESFVDESGKHVPVTVY